MSTEHEHTLNVWLASHLKSYGLAAKPEVKKPGNLRVDIEVKIGPLSIALEAEHGQSNAKKAAAIRDADARLKQVRDPAAPTPASAYWGSGNLEQLVSVIRLTPAQLGDPDSVATALSSSLDGAVERLSEGQKQDLAKALDLPASTKRKKKKPWDPAAKRALLVIVTAVMFHARLDRHRHRLRPEYDNRTDPRQRFEDSWPPLMAQQCADSSDPIQSFADAWKLILALDYKPIFETGRAALYSCSNDSAYTAAIRDTARAALAVVRTIAGLRHDLLGRIFHTVLDTARYDGSFYTTTPAATLLATLAINERMCHWQDSDAIARLRIVDPACGTGTLLMAAAERIRDLTPQTQNEEAVAKALIEQVLCGYDINLTATHMAATTLGLLSPTTQFGSMKIGRAFLGVDKFGETYLGSLEFLERQPWLLPWPTSVQAVSQIETGEEIVQSEPADLVIMNPPFTRDSLRHDQFTCEEESKIKAREKALFANKPVDLSHNGGAFLYLADFLAKGDGGVVAAVLPLVGATNYSTEGIRKYLADNFHIETIVASHDPERIYFSENTDIGEMLLICRRWPKANGPKPPTRVANLAVNPSSPSAAISAAFAIKSGSLATQGIGTLQEWPESRVAVGDWGAVQFLSPYLCAKFASLRNNELFPSIALGRISEIGPEGRRIRDAFVRSTLPDELDRVALWQHDTEKTRTMSATWDTHLSAKPTKLHLAAKYWTQRGTLLLPHRMRLNTVRALSVRLNTPVVGSLWTPCKLKISAPESRTLEKAICAYINSSIGVLSLLGDRTNKVPSYPHYSLDDLRKLVVPDFAAIGEGAATALAGTYDAYASEVLLPLPQIEHCQIRRALDDAVLEVLDLDGETVAAVRRSLASEPAVTGQRYSA